ncbi:flavin reductase [Rhizobium sp. CSW-27]|uniref:flavin reductase n=1 Tax=Rhizobium sp. CSW-27 TaxID=2839985 RepID=UPI002078E660|nr:flavin reductase [Rhizobium sp. CSW-27]
MARYAGHVQALTTEWEGIRRGVTVTAACSVSDDPATVLACLNASNEANAIFETSGRFALNTLAAHHQALARALAGFDRLPVEDRFALAEWTTLATGAPILADALVAFDCRLIDIRRMSTHIVLFGQVVDLHFGPDDQALVYLDRAFHAL